MRFFHSTPVKNFKLLNESHCANTSESFCCDFVEWSEDRLKLETTTDFRDDASKGWTMIKMTGFPDKHELAKQNDGKMTPGQRFLLYFRTLAYGVCIFKVVQRIRLHNELNEAVNQLKDVPIKRPPEQRLSSFINWNDSSQSPFASIDVSKTM